MIAYAYREAQKNREENQKIMNRQLIHKKIKMSRNIDAHNFFRMGPEDRERMLDDQAYNYFMEYNKNKEIQNKYNEQKAAEYESKLISVEDAIEEKYGNVLTQEQKDIIVKNIKNTKPLNMDYKKPDSDDICYVKTTTTKELILGDKKYKLETTEENNPPTVTQIK